VDEVTSASHVALCSPKRIVPRQRASSQDFIGMSVKKHFGVLDEILTMIHDEDTS
jgi:hypothetical protein